MGNSTLESNIVGKTGNETITNIATVSAAAINASGAVAATGAVTGASSTVTGAAQGATIVATSYITVGTAKYIFSGATSEISASIVTLASALVGIAKKGSLYMGDVTWSFDSDGTATKLP